MRNLDCNSKGKKMVVAFLDLLGFSFLLEEDPKVALNNLNNINNTLLIKKIDENSKKEDTQEGKDVTQQIKESSISSFLYMISFSDSLVLASQDPHLFIKQLLNYLADLYIEFAKPFMNSFKDINNVRSLRDTTSVRDGFHIDVIRDGAFPLLFRGGLSFGDDVVFYKENHIYNGEMEKASLSVTGLTYLEAVKLEQSGKGPRLFCNEKVVAQISDETIISKVDAEKNIYEIIWTVQACEKLKCSIGNAALKNSLYGSLFMPALNLYNNYRENQAIAEQYLELVRLVYRGSLRYAKKESDQEYHEVHKALFKILEENDIHLENPLWD